MARMELPILDKFCFVISLRNGCIIMGIVNSILSFILAVVLMTVAVDISATMESKQDEDTGMLNVVYAIVILMIILQVMKFLFDLVFVYAVHKERSGLIRKYCIFWIVFVVLSIIGFLKSLFQSSATQVILQLLFLAENFYYIIVIRSYLLSINVDDVL